MRAIIGLLFGLAMLATAGTNTVHAQSDAAYVVTYVDVMPNAAASAVALLTPYREASRKQDGNLRADVLQENARPNRFAIVEVWKDMPALDAHAHAAETLHFRDELRAIQNAPPDERIDHALYPDQDTSEHHTGENSASAIHVVTHVDVIPPGKDDCIAALKVMSIETPKDPGNISYAVLQQANRSNHFTVLEEWTDMNAVDAHAIAAHTREFRAKISPIAGALYDERFYKILN